MVHSHFDVQAQAPQQQLLAWRERVGHVIDVLPSLSDLGKPFCGAIDRYQVGKLVFTDCRTDALVLDRSLARISRDSIRDIAFHVFLEGGVDDVALRRGAGGTTSVARILALDLNQPVRMRRHACRVLTLFAPAALVQESFPDPEAIHGRTLDVAMPTARLAVAHCATLAAHIAGMNAVEADSAIRIAVQLLVSAFGVQTGLTGNARAAVRAAMSGQVRRYVREHLADATLSPESVLATLPFPRRSVYRLFEHEGGLNTYIRHLRLRRAADELVGTGQPVTQIAYSLGFSSPSDFTRAFRRAHGMTPQDFRNWHRII
jgi:AraC-like DNA-binding protein